MGDLGGEKGESGALDGEPAAAAVGIERIYLHGVSGIRLRDETLGQNSRHIRRSC